MKIAVGSDGTSAALQRVVAWLQERGHEVSLYGAVGGDDDSWNWPATGARVAGLVASGAADQAVLMCWTGTGISIAANKVRGVRAALCSDAETARGARQWNDANVLALSQRLLTEALADEILQAWFDAAPSDDSQDVTCLRALDELDGAR